uniref:Uncharacterized protein n=1 Tax=Anguilla anguilla TaxID=7936 RepID=A0A0E9R556_ANGAN
MFDSVPKGEKRKNGTLQNLHLYLLRL